MLQSLTDSDLCRCREIYRAAALQAKNSGYSSTHLQVWASFADAPEFRDFIYGDRHIGFWQGDLLVGFGSWREDGYLKSLYVEPQFQGRGIGSALVTGMLADFTWGYEITVDASTLSMPLFKKFGFRIVAEEKVVRGGLTFRRFQMGLVQP